MRSNVLSELTYSEKTAKRAQWESFEFSVPANGTVVVANVSYGDEADEHTHAVNVEDGVPTSCTCKGDEYQPGACKHRVAVAINAPVLSAASASGPDGKRALADGGALVEPVQEENDEDEDCDCAHFEEGALPCFECYREGIEEVPAR